MKCLCAVICCLMPAAAVLCRPAVAADDEDKPKAAALHKNGANAEKEKRDERGAVHLSPEALKVADLEVQPVSGGMIDRAVEAPGEISLNLDKMAHLTPKTPGSVTRVWKVVGDKVSAGETLAIIESAELGNAKIDYFTAKLNLDLARTDLEREQQIHDNTEKLLEILKGEPEPAELEKKLSTLSLGDVRSKLISAYSARRLASAAWVRTQKLKDDNLITGSAIESAVKDMETSKADYLAAIEELKINYKSRFLQTQRAFKIAETAEQNADRRLHILGLSPEQIANLPKEKDELVAQYELKAPFAGTILEKHIVQGEHVDESKDVFAIGDLSLVWINLRIYTNNLSRVKAGQTVRISVSGQEKVQTGQIAQIFPLVDERSRSAMARVVLDNSDGALRPGLFVTASIILDQHKAPLVVPVDAVQTLEGKSVVFVAGDEEGEFLPKPVLLGISDGGLVEIKAGIVAGSKVVVRNSFTLKAELGKGAEEE